MNKPFHFKKFSVSQDRCAMKIGTDGVLLGAWTNLENRPNSILDIGTGTGLIALMLAQRCNAQTIDAVEIDQNAHEQCVENFETSPWNDRLFCYHASLAEFAEEIDSKYDLIVSNPPFYDAEYLSAENSRNKARFSISLPFPELLGGASALLSETGTFCTVLPHKNQREFVQIAKENNLHLQKLTCVQGNHNAPIKRNLLQFGFKAQTTTNTLVIEKKRHQYTQTYRALVKDFYLKI